MGYQSQQQQPYFGGGMGTNPLSATGQRYGNYGGSRFQNNGVGNSNRYGSQFRPGSMGTTGGNMSVPGSQHTWGPQQSQPFGTSPSQPLYQPQGNSLGRPGQDPNPLAGGSRPMSGGFGPVPPTGPMDDQNRLLQSMFGSSQYAPQQGPSNYSFNDQTEQLRRLYGF